MPVFDKVMRIYFYIVLLLIQSAVLAQVHNDTVPVIYSWKLDNRYSEIQIVPIDTNLQNFQFFYPNYQNSISNTYLGNQGTATLPNVYSDRIISDDAFFINSFLPYFQTVDNTRYYNTRKQFSRLFYTFENLRKSDEITFEAFHTQNLSPKLNIGLRFHNIKAKGQYRYLKVKKNSFRLFGSYNSQKYILHTSLNMNYYNNNESGGIIDSYFRDSTYNDISDIPTVINGSGSPYFDSDAENIVRFADVLLSQQLKLFTLASKKDTSENKKAGIIAEPIITHVFKLSRSTKKYLDADPVTPGLYSEYYFNTLFTNDSVFNFNISNTLQLEFKTTFRKKFQTGIYGLIGYEIDKYKIFSEWDTTYNPTTDSLLVPIIEDSGDTLKGVDISERFDNTFFSAGIYGNFKNRVKAQFSGTFYLSGYKSGQTEIKATLNTDITLFKREFQILVEGLVENKKPGYLLETYYSNHYMWDQELKSQNDFRLSSVLSSPSKNFELRCSYYVLNNFIYFNFPSRSEWDDEEVWFNSTGYARGRMTQGLLLDVIPTIEYARPKNYENILNYLSVEATKTFQLWELYSLNKIVYQATENPNVLPLPALVIYNSTYWDHTFRFKLTDGLLQAILGIEIYYNTRFNGYEYSPALSVFYVQNEEKIGNYPLMDLFLNLKVKRTRFFAKLQHLNSLWNEPNYYSAIHYPYNQFTLKFGLSWVFYD